MDLSGHGVYGQQNHKTPNWQKKNKKKPRNFLENGVLLTIVANGFRGESWLLYKSIVEHGDTVS